MYHLNKFCNIIFEPLDRVEFFVGNECDIIVTRKDGDSSRLEMTLFNF